jgi:hypothetical protein
MDQSTKYESRDFEIIRMKHKILRYKNIGNIFPIRMLIAQEKTARINKMEYIKSKCFWTGGIQDDDYSTEADSLRSDSKSSLTIWNHTWWR